MKIHKMLLAGAFAAGALMPALASAQELVDRKSPLEGAPAIRHRVELRDKRFEAGVGVGSSVAAEFYNAVFVNLRLGFHLTDWLTLAGTYGRNVTPGYKTGVAENLETSLKARSPTDAGAATPTSGQALGAMNRMSDVFSLQAEVAPITGKMSLFGKIFMHYDFYALGGGSMVKFTASLPESDLSKCSPAQIDASCPDIGNKFGGTLGFGTHAYFNNWLALNLEIKDLIVKTNRAGQDATGDGFANDRDLEWGHNYILGANMTFFFPTVPKITD